MCFKLRKRSAIKPFFRGGRYNRVESKIERLRQKNDGAFPDTEWQNALDGVDVSGESERTIMSFMGELPRKPRLDDQAYLSRVVDQRYVKLIANA